MVQVERIERARQVMRTPDNDWPEPMRVFQYERHLFLISAYKLIEHVDWALRLNFLDKSLFAEIHSLRGEIKSLRDMNEHAVEYFLGKGRRRDEWLHVDEGAIADASSTIDTKIGNRLDWNEVATITRRLLNALPKFYYPIHETNAE